MKEILIENNISFLKVRGKNNFFLVLNQFLKID